MSSKAARPRILFFLPEAGAGGAEKIFAHLVAGFPSEEAELLLATDPAILARIREVGGGGFTYLAWSVDGSFDTPSKVPREAWRLRRILCRHGVTHLFAMKHYAASLAAFATRFLRNRPRLVLSFRGPAEQHIASMVPKRRTRAYLRALVRFSAACADRISVPARGIGEDLIANFGVEAEKIQLIRNGIDRAAVARLSSAPFELPGLDPARRHLVAVSRLSAEKRPEWVVEAFSYLAPQLPEYDLLILGEGSERDALAQRARDAGIADRISFLGHQANVYPYLRRAVVLLHACQYEGLPNAIIEAMACGTPVVATDCPFGPRELLGNNERGLLVPTKDPSALALAVQRLVGDEELRSRIVAAARSYVEDLTISAMIAQYRELILHA